MVPSSADGAPDPRSRRALRAAAGPVLIVAASLLVLRTFVLHDRLTGGDVLKEWLPTFCHLGRAVANGHVPAWTPYLFGGAPFAADPQSGWLALPQMTLFAALPCDVAIRALILLQPVLGGLGIYAFLRGERLSRPAATVGGLTLALGIAGCQLAVFFSFAATLAWTAVTLAAASRALAARTSSRLALWLLATALAWGQLVDAHMSVGALMGTGAVAAYLVARWWTGVRREGRPSRRYAGRIGALAVWCLAVNLALLLPRLAYLGRTNLGLGYGALDGLASRLAGQPVRPVRPGITTGPTWPLKLATTPGGHVALIVLCLAGAALWDRRHRALAVSMMAFGALCYTGSLGAVADAFPVSWGGSKVGSLYLHNPYWLGFALLPAVAVLGALGLEAFLGASGWRRRVAMVAPGAAAFVVLPAAFGAPAAQLAAGWIGAAAGVGALVMASRWNRPAAVPAVVVAELIAVSLWGGPEPARPAFRPLPIDLVAVKTPTVDGGAYLRRTGFEERMARGGLTVGRGRSMTIGPEGGFGTRADAALITALPTIDGYDPVQILSTWTFVRQVQHARIRYNRSYFRRVPGRSVLDLFEVGWIVSSQGGPPPPGTDVVAREGRWRLFRVRTPAAPATVVGAWRVAPGNDAALRTVTSRAFDPERTVVLERDPGLGGAPTGPSGSASYRALGPQHATIAVAASAPSIVLVRVPYDPGWSAQVDGRPRDVLRADGFLMGIPVGPGRHAVDLSYGDPSLGYGAVGSAVAVGALLVLAALARRRERSREMSAIPSSPPSTTAEPARP